MATEQDKTNTGVAGTAIAIGVAAMIAGSAALVSMARTEMQEQGQENEHFADLDTVRQLRTVQHERLSTAKVSIDQARSVTLAAIKGDPDQASPWTPKPEPTVEEAPSAASGLTTDGAEGATGQADGAPGTDAAPTASTTAAAPTAAVESATATSAAPTSAPTAVSTASAAEPEHK